MPTRRVVVGGIAATAGLAVSGVPAIGRSEALGQTLAERFRDWLGGLTDRQRDRAIVPFDDAERFNWHYTPRRRKGLPLEAMTEPQRQGLFALLAFGLGEAGYAKTRDIIRLEKVLGEIETFGFSRDPELYFLTVFGAPADTGVWGWRFEGHHLSLNMAFRDATLVAATPCFLGANPAVVPVGHDLAGLEVLGGEIGLARTLLNRLDDGQRGAAVIADRSFGDIVAGPGREDALAQPEGLAVSAMTTDQTETLVALIEAYAGVLPEPWAANELRRVRAAGLDGIRFAWAGATEPGPGRGHYFRVHGPAVLIEYDNTRTGANHVHSVWHDPGNPFGRDVLGAHYRHGHRHG